MLDEAKVQKQAVVAPGALVGMFLESIYSQGSFSLNHCSSFLLSWIKRKARRSPLGNCGPVCQQLTCAI